MPGSELEVSEIIAVAMLAALSAEVPRIAEDPRYAKHRDGVVKLAKITAEVTEPGVERAAVVAIQFYESRYRLRPRDGDPRFDRATNRTVGTAVGPMQLSKGATWWLPRVDPQWRGVTVAALRDPRTNVSAGVSVLRHWRRECGGRPGAWISAYGWGKCTPRGYVDREGVRRCAVTAAVLRRLGETPEGWECGHERKRVDPHTARVVRAIVGT